MNGAKETEVLKALEGHACMVEPLKSIGEYDLCALIFAESIAELDRIAFSIKEQFGTRKVTINMWSGPAAFTYANLNLQPLGRKRL